MSVEEERKKRKLDVIQKNAQESIDFEEASRTKYRTLTDSVENIWTTKRNAILSGVSFSTPLLLGLYLAKVVPDIMLTLLFIDLVVGLIVPVILSVTKGKLHAFSLQTDDYFFFAKLMVINFKRYSVTKACKLDEIQEDRIDFIYSFTTIVEAGVAYYLTKALDKLLGTRFFWRIRPYGRIAKDIAQTYEAQMYLMAMGSRALKKINADTLSIDQKKDYEFFTEILLPYFEFLAEGEKKQHQTTENVKPKEDG